MKGGRRGSARRGPKRDKPHASPTRTKRAARPQRRSAPKVLAEAKTVDTRVDRSELEAALATPAAPLKVSEWLWTTREGAERDLIEELLRDGPEPTRPRLLGPALVASARAPRLHEGRLELTFARQGFRVLSLAQHEAMAELAAQLSPSLRASISTSERHALHVFVPDSAHGNALSAQAQALRAQLERDIQHITSAHETLAETQLRRQGGTIAQVCLYDARIAAAGCIASEQALSLWPGGRARMRLGGAFPSRAARKLAEAFAWLGLAPGSGELCVDLGAAPGGWSWLLLEKRARVIAVDPARMDAKLMRNPRLRHVQGNAFEYQPAEPVDWLFCDMAYRPLEVAQMLGRWARRRDTRLVVANFKLPMKRKVEMVERIRGILRDSGFTSIRTRQLYHDREEITLTAHVR